MKQEHLEATGQKPDDFNTIYSRYDDLYKAVQSGAIDLAEAKVLNAVNKNATCRFTQLTNLGKQNPHVRPQLPALFGLEMGAQEPKK